MFVPPQGSAEAGRFTISTVNIQAGGVLNMTEELQYRLELTSLTVAPSGSILASDLHLETTNVIVEEGGVIDLSQRQQLRMGNGVLSPGIEDIQERNTYFN